MPGLAITGPRRINRVSKNFPEIDIKNRAALRVWLDQNHDSAGTVWMIYHKAGHADAMKVVDIVPELLAWGWIDGITRRVDEARRAKDFTAQPQLGLVGDQ